MYGFFNHAFEKFIIQQYGAEKWEIIRLEAGIFEESFDEKLIYDDNMIIELIDSASDVLDVKPEDLQSEFGELYFEHCLGTKHGDLMKNLSRNLYDFLANIDSIHDYLSLVYPGLKIPTFRVKEDVFRRCITVQYYSDREQLEFITKGIIEQAARKLFNLNVTVQIFFDANPDSNTFLITADDPADCERMFPKLMESSRDLIPRANESKVSPLEFTKFFPFHMIFDREMELIQMGATLRRILKDINTSKTAPVTNYFTLSRPQIKFDFDSIYSRLNNSFVLTSLQDVVKPTASQPSAPGANAPRRANLRLKGEMIYIEDHDAMLFLCSPSVSNIADMRHKGLCLSDIPIHDATRDLVLLSDNIQKELELTNHLGIVGDHLEKIRNELESEMALYNRLLYAVLPNSIAQSLCDMEPVPAEKYDCVTIMFSAIVKFADLCQELDSQEIVSMLNDLYTKFDVLVSFLDGFAYKVETVGDTYMTASGLPERVYNHPYVICTLALDMFDVAKEVLIKGKPISVTFGVHSGEVVAGVIGQKMPRYCLFGNAVNLTSRTQSTGLHGRINVTEDTYRLLEESDSFDHFFFEKRGHVQMKGKAEPMLTYVLRRAENKRDKMRPLSLEGLIPFHNSCSASSNAVLTSPVTGGGFTLNRNRTSAALTGLRKSRNASSHASRFTTPGQSRFATPSGRSRCNSSLSTSPFKTNSLLQGDEDESIWKPPKSPQASRKAPVRRIKSNLAFEVLNEVDYSSDCAESFPNLKTPTNEYRSTEPPLTALGADHLPPSVSPILNRRVNVKGILAAVNQTLSQE